MRKVKDGVILTTQEVKEYVTSHNNKIAETLYRRYWYRGKCKLKDNNEYILYSYEVPLYEEERQYKMSHKLIKMRDDNREFYDIPGE